MKRKIRSIRSIIPLTFYAAIFAASLGAVFLYQRDHATPTKASMSWTQYIQEADNIIVSQNYDYDVLDANTSVAAFIDNRTGDVLFDRTDDGGQTWQRYHIQDAGGWINDYITMISVTAVDANTFFVAYEGTDGNNFELAYSTDGGMTWGVNDVEIGGGPGSFYEAYVEAADANNVAVAYLRSNGDTVLATSTDGGVNFSSLVVTNGADPEGLQMVSPNDIFVSYIDGSDQLTVSVSSDGGASIDFATVVGDAFNGANTDLSAIDSSNMAVCYYDLTDQHPIYAYSTNGAASFTSEDIALDTSTGQHCSLQMISATDAVVAEIDDIGHNVVALLTNSGTTVNYTEPLSGDSTGVMYLKALDMNNIFVSAPLLSGVVMASTSDGGATPWTRFGVAGQRVYSVASHHPTIPTFGTFYTAFYDGIGQDLHILRYIDPDGWTNSFIDGNDGSDVGNFTAMSAPFRDTAFVMYFDATNNQAKVAYTSDQGNTWGTSVVGSTGTGSQESLSINSIDGITVDAVLFDDASQELRYYQSTDGAQTWNFVNVIDNGVPEMTNVNIQRIDANTLDVSYYYQGVIAFTYSTDNAANWNYQTVDTLADDNQNEIKMVASDANHIYVGAYDHTAAEERLYFSADGGASWDSSTADYQHTGGHMDMDVQADPADFSIPHVAFSWLENATNLLYYAYSIDDGATFFTVVPDLNNTAPAEFNTVVEFFDFHVVGSDKVTAGGYPFLGGPFLGAMDNWAQVSIDNSVDDVGSFSDMVAINDSQLFTSYIDSTNGDGNFAISQNGGTTWATSNVDINTDATSIDALDSSRIVYAYLYNNGGPADDVWIAVSDDLGANWNFFPVEQSADAVGNVSVAMGNHDTFFVTYTHLSDGHVYAATTTDDGNSFNIVDVASGEITSSSAIDAADLNTAYLTFYDSGSSNLRSAVTTDWGTNWTVNTIDTSGDVVGAYNSIKVMDANTALVAYSDDTTHQLLFSQTTDGGFSWDGGSAAVVDTAVGNYSAISIDAVDAGHIYITDRTAPTNELELHTVNDGDAPHYPVSYWNRYRFEGDIDSLTTQSATVDALFVSGHDLSSGDLIIYKSADFVPVPPSDPTLVFPEDGVTRRSTVVISALYDASILTGTTHYRISSTSFSDCVNGLNIVDSGTSATTATNSEATKVQLSSGMFNGNTYFWCAQNDDGSQQSNWVGLGSFLYNTAAPDLTYLSYLGGSGDDFIQRIKLVSGILYITGNTGSSDFPTTVGAYDTTYAGSDIVVAAMDLSLSGSSQLLFSTFVGGANAEGTQAMDIDSSYIYIAGTTTGASFPTTGSAYDATFNGGLNDTVLFRLTIDGSTLDYSTYIGGSGFSFDVLNGLKVVGGKMYLSGFSISSDFPTTVGAYDTTPNGSVDMVFVKFDPSISGAGGLLYSTFIGGTSADNAYAMDMNGSDVYIVGKTSGTFPTTSGAYDETANGVDDMVVLQFTETSSNVFALVYSSYVGAGFNDTAFQVTYDSGLLRILGSTTGSGFPTTGTPYSSTYTGPWHFVYLTFQPLGGGSSDLVYSTYLWPTDLGNFATMFIDGGKAYITGIGTSSITPTSDAFGVTGAGFLARFNPAGGGASDLEYFTHIGGGYNTSWGLAVENNIAYVMGSLDTSSTIPAFSFGNTPYDSTRNGGVDGALMTFDFTPPTNFAPTAPPSLYVGNSDAQSGSTNPTGITSSTPVFSAICNDPDSGDILNKYRLEVDDNNDFSSMVWDSGAAGTAMTNCVAGARSANITFGGTPLTLNGTTYYWRIKFWDDQPTEGAFSESPTSTQTFTMATAGGGGGSGSSIQRLQQLSTIAVPTIGPLTVVGPSSIRYEWTYGNTSSISGFRLLNDQDQVAVQVASPTAIAATEEGLPHNSQVSGRKVTAYNSSGESAPSSVYPDAYTWMIHVTPKLASREDGRIAVSVNEALNNLHTGQSGVQFELISTAQTTASSVDQSPWVQETPYVFEGVDSTVTYLVRARARNFDAVTTEWSNTMTVGIETLIPKAPQLQVTLSLTSNDGQSLDTPLNPNTVLSGEIHVVNNGEGEATNVLAALPLPAYVSYIPGTMSVDGRGQTDGVDGDAGQFGNDTLAAIWPRLTFGFGHIIRFQLGFDTQRLAKTFAAANPTITLQAQVTSTETPNPVFSDPQVLEPDISFFTSPAPVPPVVPVPPTPQQVQIIQQILQQQFPQPGVQTSQTPIPQGQTTSSFSGGSFEVSTGSGDQALSMSGHATLNNDEVRFTGTTSQPFAVITLIFNGSITVIATSDAQGNWQTFVSAEQLGIKPGQQQSVIVEAIASNGLLQSERVKIADVLLARGEQGQIVAEFPTVVSQQGLLRAVSDVKQVVTQNEPAIQTTLVVTAPVVIASSLPLWGYLPYAPTLIYHFIIYLLGYSGRKKRLAAHFYGVAYDAINKQPLALAIIRIYKVESMLAQAASLGAAATTNKKLVTTVVTDKQGRYDALLEPGQYTLEVAKPGYLFPSQIVSTEIDADYQHVYSNAKGITVEGEQITIPDVPLDPINAARQWQLASGMKKVRLAIQNVGNYLAAPILIVGAITSAVVVAAVPDKAINWIIAAFYIVLLSLQIKLRQKVEKAWGVVYDIATDAVLPLVAIQLIEPTSSKVVTSRLTDFEGRFTFLTEPGDYVLKASKPGYEQVTEVVQGYKDRQPLGAQIHIEKAHERVSGDVAMKQTS